jgi:dTDP-glucose 4,6-dehydratase
LIRSLGWTPDYPREKFEQGLRETVEWYLDNKEWVEDLWKKKDEMNKWMETFVQKSDKPMEVAA